MLCRLYAWTAIVLCLTACGRAAGPAAAPATAAPANPRTSAADGATTGQPDPTGAPAAADDPERVAERLRVSREAERYELKQQGSEIDLGGARVHVESSMEALERVLLDFDNYTKLGKEFDRVKTLRKYPDGKKDVYVRFPILHGAAYMWMILQFEPMRCDATRCELSAHLVKGNVDRFDVRYVIHRLGDASCQLDVEMLVEPRLPFPASVVSQETSRQAAKAARRIRNAAERDAQQNASARDVRPATERAN